jgi:hypothetical protein
LLLLHDRDDLVRETRGIGEEHAQPTTWVPEVRVGVDRLVLLSGPDREELGPNT